MKFGRVLRRARHRSRIPDQYFFDYDRLKRVVEEIKQNGDGTESESHDFRVQIEAELDKLFAFTQNVSVEISAKIKKVISTLRCFLKVASSSFEHDQASFKDLALYRQEASAIIEDIQFVADFININRIAIRKILKKHDKCASHEYGALFEFHLARKPFHKLPLNLILAGLSELFSLLRRAEHRVRSESLTPGGGSDSYTPAPQTAAASGAAAAAGGGGGVRTQSTTEATTAFARNSAKYWVAADDVVHVLLMVVQHLPYYVFGGPGGSGDLPAVTSVYFDNDDLALYHARQNRVEGAKIVRVRWYGPEADPLFVEQKVHHEAWTYEESVKTRFQVTEAHMDDYLRGDWSIRDEELKLRKKGMSDSAIAAQVELCDEVSSLIHTQKLRPMVRTSYTRAAFQVPGDAGVRISVDLGLRMSAEERCIPGHWRSEIGPGGEETVKFPHSVLEVKLMMAEGVEAPAWIQALQSSALLVPVHKFSKFGHGCYMLQRPRCQVEPYWIPQMGTRIGSQASGIFDDFRGADKAETVTTIGDYTMASRVALISDESTPTAATAGAAAATSAAAPRSPRRAAEAPAARESAPATRATEATPLLSTGVRPAGQPRGFKKEAVGMDHQPTFFSWLRGSWKSTARPRASAADGQIKTPIRVEPKTFFANERTFLHWLNVGVMLGVMGVTLTRQSSDFVVTQVAGLLFLPAAVAFMLYAYGVFLYRNQMIMAGQQLRYDDRRGPLFMLIVLLALFAFTALAQLHKIVPALAVDTDGPRLVSGASGGMTNTGSHHPHKLAEG